MSAVPRYYCRNINCIANCNESGNYEHSGNGDYNYSGSRKVCQNK